MLEKLTRDIFAHHLHTHFLVESGVASSAVMELIEARVASSPPGYEAFSVMFRGPSDPLLPRGGGDQLSRSFSDRMMKGVYDV
jgi:hypothetical protein